MSSDVGREYKVVDKLDRRTTFESVSDKESFKISMQLQARYEGACEVKRHMNAVVFAADIGGGEIKEHVISMRPAVGWVRDQFLVLKFEGSVKGRGRD